MKRLVSISNANKDTFEMDLEVSRFEYLPIASMKIRSASVSDNIEVLSEVATKIENGGNMRDVRIGDDNAFMSFVRQDGDKTVEVTIKNTDSTIVQKYDAEDLAVAIRFIVAENFSTADE